MDAAALTNGGCVPPYGGLKEISDVNKSKKT